LLCEDRGTAIGRIVSQPDLEYPFKELVQSWIVFIRKDRLSFGFIVIRLWHQGSFCVSPRRTLLRASKPLEHCEHLAVGGKYRDESLCHDLSRAF